MMKDHSSGDPGFYEAGLRFRCTRCSACCRYESGYVFLSPGDLRRLAASLAMPESSFIQVYCRWIREGEREHLSLKERANFDCIFWKEGCTVYQVRPLQCRTFPFWPRNLDSPEDWERVSRECPGAGRGDLHEAKEIEAYLAEQDTERPLSRPTGGGSRNI